MEEHAGDAGGSATAEGLKRKRSNSPERVSSVSAPPAKFSKTLPGAHVDFLATLPAEDPLQLIDIDDSLRFIQQHLEQYSGAIERHESLAANLGAKLQAPNTIKRFERMFMHPMKILANHGKDSNTVTWLDIVRFYEDKPHQMKLHSKDGAMVCQFYTKQCRVEISEDEYEFIRSGQPQKMLPARTLPSDEEKELGTIEYLEQKIAQITKLADQVSGRSKVLLSRLKARRNALAAKREGDTNGAIASGDGLASEKRSASPVGGFTAINAQSRDANINGITTTSAMSRPLVSSAVRQELAQVFASNRERQALMNPEYRNQKSRNRPADMEYTSTHSSSGPAPPPTPGVNTSAPRPSPAEKMDNDGPFKAEMLSRMDKMPRYTVVKPPCDRCRRLQIDCQKNLTACLGCTRKHAKCSWKDVTDQELRDNPPVTTNSMHDAGRRGSMSGSAGGSDENGPHLPVRDEELLGEDDSDDETSAAPALPRQSGEGHSDPFSGQPSSPGLRPTITNQSIGGGHASSSVAVTPGQSAPVSPPPSLDQHRLSQSTVVSASKLPPTEPSEEYTAATHVSSGSIPSTFGVDQGSQNNTSNMNSIKLEASQQSNGDGQTAPRLPSFPNMLGDRMIDNPALLGTATGDRLARDAQEQIERMNPTNEPGYDGKQHSGPPESNNMHGHPGITNGMTKV